MPIRFAASKGDRRLHAFRELKDFVLEVYESICESAAQHSTQQNKKRDDSIQTALEDERWKPKKPISPIT